MESWHRVYREPGPPGSAGRFQGVAPDGSFWFSGHFPGDPILPGIAILAMVREALMVAESGQGRSARIEGVRRVRFWLPVRPDDRLDLTFAPAVRGDRVHYTFKVSRDDKMVCSGIFVAAVSPA